MKTGKKQEWQDLITGLDKQWHIWNELKKQGNGNEKLDAYFKDLYAIVNGYLKLKNGQIFDTLTNRERDIVHLICHGKTNDEIAKALNIANNTVETHRGNLFGKLGVRNVQELILMAVRAGGIKI